MFANTIDLDTAGVIVDQLTASDASLRVVQIRVLGGAVARVPADATAYAHRTSPIMVNVAAFYDGRGGQGRSGRRRSISLAGDLHQGDDGAYVNFVGDEGADRVRAAYPGATWDRLAAVKATYDPDNLFRLNQNVTPAASMTVRIASVTFDCADALTVGRFWSAALGRPLDPERPATSRPSASPDAGTTWGGRRCRATRIRPGCSPGRRSRRPPRTGCIST